MAVPERRGRRFEAAPGCVLRREHKLAEFHHVGDSFGTERDEPFQPRSARPKRRRSKHEARLEGSLRFTQEGKHQPGPAAKPAEDSAFAHTGVFSEPVHGQALGAALLNKFLRSLQQAFPVPRGIAAFRGGLRGQPGPQWDEAHIRYSKARE